MFSAPRFKATAKTLPTHARVVLHASTTAHERTQPRRMLLTRAVLLRKRFRCGPVFGKKASVRAVFHRMTEPAFVCNTARTRLLGSGFLFWSTFGVRLTNAA